MRFACAPPRKLGIIAHGLEDDRHRMVPTIGIIHTIDGKKCINVVTDKARNYILEWLTTTE